MAWMMHIIAYHDQYFFLLVAKELFMKTGCLMTADGLDDDMIKPQGLELYSFNFYFSFLLIA